MNKQVVVSGIIGITLVGGWALMKKRPAPRETSLSQQEEMANRIPSGANDSSASSQSKSSDQVSLKRQAASEKISPQDSTLAPKIAAKQTIPAETLRDLQDFHVWNSKPFPSSEESERRKAMLRDPGFLRGLGDLLVSVEMTKDPKFEEAENSALDLLVESLKSGDRETSLGVIQQVIRDAQVENPQLPTETREILAGVKAELLFHAVALAPQEFSNISNLLPGPVSQKIWANVQAQHRQNLAESQVEVQQYQSKAGR